MPFTAVGAYDCLSALVSNPLTITGLTHMDDRYFGRLIKVSSANQVVIYLPRCVGNAGKWIGFTFDGLSGGALCAVGIAEGSSDVFAQGVRSSPTGRWYCSGEMMVLYCDGTKWIVKYETTAAVAFRAYRTIDSYQTVATGTYVKMNLDNADYNIGGFYDTGSYLFKPYAPGRYWVTLQVYTNSALVDGRYLTAVPYVSGSLYRWVGQFRDGTSTNQAVNLQCEVFLNGGALVGAANADYLEMYAYHNTGVNETVGSNYTGMRAVRLSRDIA